VNSLRGLSELGIIGHLHPLACFKGFIVEGVFDGYRRREEDILVWEASWGRSKKLGSVKLLKSSITLLQYMSSYIASDLRQSIC
jgi:hypothetical protein